MNLEELGGDDTPASVSLEVENNGIEPIDTIAVYAKRIGSDEEYAFIDSFDVSTLYPGQTKELVFDLSEEFRDPSRFSIGVIGSSGSYAREDLQSLTILDVPEGTLKISDSDYSYRRLDHDRYAVTVTSAGPGKKSGTLVIHDPKTGEIVKEVRIENLAPSETTEIVICDEEGVLSESYAKLGACLIRGEETAETRTAQADDTETFLMPRWFGSSMPVEEIKPSPQDDRKTESSSEKEESDHSVIPVPSFRISSSNDGKRTAAVNTSDQNHVLGHGFVLIVSLIAAAVSRKMLKDQNE
jgi:hypothetical protein